MKILVTGASGFVGRHLCRLALSKKGVRVYGLVRKGSAKKLLSGVRPVEAELLSEASLRRALSRVRPDRIYHLAGQASVPDSWKDPKRTFDVNVKGTRCLLEAVRKMKRRPKVLVSCSSDEYGFAGAWGKKIAEETPLKPSNPYAASKLAQELLAGYYFSDHKVPIVRTRAFNHIGPGQDDRFAVASFAKQVAEIERGKKAPEIQVGNLEAVRDFTDVRDVVRAYWLALEKGRPGRIYNVASGRGRRIADVLNFYLKRSSVKISVRVDRARMRASDTPYLVGDASKLRRDTGWGPKIPFERTLRDTLDDWRERLCTS